MTMANTAEESSSAASFGNPNPEEESLNSNETEGLDDSDRSSDKEEICRRETRAVQIVRVLMFLVLLTAGVLLSTATYFYTSDRQKDEWEAQYNDQALRVQQAVADRLALQLSMLDDMAVDLVSTSSSWPEVTMPKFERKVAKRRSLTGVETVLWAPLVTSDTLSEWHDYSEDKLKGWLSASWEIQSKSTGLGTTQAMGDDDDVVVNEVYNVDGSDLGITGPYLPLWQVSPPPIRPSTGVINANLLNLTDLAESLETVWTRGQAVVMTLQLDDALSLSPTPRDQFLNQVLPEPLTEPLVASLYPIFDDKQLVGVVASLQTWSDYLTSVLEPSVGGMVVVLQDLCRQTDHSFQVEGTEAYYLGNQDSHDSKVNAYKFQVNLEVLLSMSSYPVNHLDAPLSDYCPLNLQTYPSQQQPESDSSVNEPALYTAVVALIFGFCILLFGVYDCLVERRQTLVLTQAQQSTAIVSSLFPDVVRDRLLQTNNTNHGNTATTVEYDLEPKEGSSRHGNHDIGTRSMSDIMADMSEASDASPVKRFLAPAKLRLKSFLRDENGDQTDVSIDESKPIADFFPHCTVLFADIVGFTAWSSQREPAQVFMLLQNLYGVFDKAARKRGVFKVETIGDSYVAVTGLPDPQSNHAEIMAEFAIDIRRKMKEVTRKLERRLGPETGDLSMRFGLHSGPVTAGVLRGERSRFQLFGDTVNTAARMESTGKKNCLQISESTAVQLMNTGKEDWVSRREDTVAVKGKGEMQTYWLEPTKSSKLSRRASTDSCMSFFSSSTDSIMLPDASMVQVQVQDEDEDGRPKRPLIKHQDSRIWGKSEIMDTEPTKLSRSRSSDPKSRLIDWNVDVLLRLLKRVVAQRKSVRAEKPSSSPESPRLETTLVDKGSPLEEVQEIITLPNFDPESIQEHIDPESIELDEEVVSQLRDYVTCIAGMYRDNPFHNFQHACHVSMSIVKLLERVVTPEEIDYDAEQQTILTDAHNYTYGITSDPLTQFAVVFCALIHDVDHTGVANTQLIQEKAHIASFYNNKSVAEQNSVDLAWDLLMDTKYTELRDCIYSDESEFKRFRQLIVNVVLATDIFDKELSALRKNRWVKAFNEVRIHEPPTIDANRKATIVIEHLIQASDVSHTMQHWDIYRKWNERLFFEMYQAYKSGRTDKDPSGGWYGGELWFFDNYVIPLAKKLKDCGVFGVSSDECLNYALENRALWESEGKKIVADMLASEYLAKIREKEDRRSRPKGRTKKNGLGLD